MRERAVAPTRGSDAVRLALRVRQTLPMPHCEKTGNSLGSRWFFDRFQTGDGMAETTQAARPLSPHLQIYRWTWTMTMSIVHRATGCALYGGTLLIAAWLIAAASGKT